MFRRTLATLLLAATFFACAPNREIIQEPNRQRAITYGNCFGTRIIPEEEIHYSGGTRSLITTEYYLDLCQPHKRKRFSIYPNGQTSTTNFYFFYNLDDRLSITIIDKGDDGIIDTVIRDGIRYTDRNDPDRKERGALQKFLDLERKEH